MHACYSVNWWNAHALVGFHICDVSAPYKLELGQPVATRPTLEYFPSRAKYEAPTSIIAFFAQYPLTRLPLNSSSHHYAAGIGEAAWHARRREKEKEREKKEVAERRKRDEL